jgi:hypothetical protein
MYWACSVAEEKEMKPTIARCVGKHRFGSFTYRRRKRRSFAIPRVILADMHMIYGDIIFMHEYVFNAGHVQTVVYVCTHKHTGITLAINLLLHTYVPGNDTIKSNSSLSHIATTHNRLICRVVVTPATPVASVSLIVAVDAALDAAFAVASNPRQFNSGNTTQQ